MSAVPAWAPRGVEAALQGVPAALSAPVLASLGGAPVDGWAEGPRRFLIGEGAFGCLSTEPADAAVLAREVECRRRVGTLPPLRSPAVVACGDGWHVAERVAELPVEAADPDAVAEALALLSRLELPPHPPRPAGPAASRGRAAVRLLASPLPVREVVRSRRAAADRRLPQVTVHGDLHPRNALPVRDGLAVVDWELSGRGVAGADAGRLVAEATAPYAALVLDALARRTGWDRGALEAQRRAQVVRTAADLVLDGREPQRVQELVRRLR